MAHKRQDTYTASKEWWVHLRPYNKRLQAKAERRAAKDEIKGEMEPDETPKGLGLHKSPKTMRELKATKGESVVPRGIYCYDEKGNCPYWDVEENKPEQDNGFCWFLGKGDWDDDMGEIWDQCKCCGIRDEEIPEGTMEVVDE